MNYDAWEKIAVEIRKRMDIAKETAQKKQAEAQTRLKRPRKNSKKKQTLFSR